MYPCLCTVWWVWTNVYTYRHLKQHTEHSLSKKRPSALNSHTHSPLWFPTLSISFVCSRASYKWNRAEYALFVFLSFNTFLSSSHSVSAIPSPSLMSSIQPYKYTTSCLFTSWGTYELFPAFSCNNKAARNICIQAFLLGKCTRAELLGLRVNVSNIRNCQPALPGGCVFLYSHQPCLLTSPVAPYPSQHLVLSVFWILAMLLGTGISHCGLIYKLWNVFPSSSNLLLLLQNTGNMV